MNRAHRIELISCDYKEAYKAYLKSKDTLNVLGFSLSLEEEEPIYIEPKYIIKTGKHRISDSYCTKGSWCVNMTHFYFVLSKDMQEIILSSDYLLDEDCIYKYSYEDGEFYECGMSCGWTSYTVTEVESIYPNVLEYVSTTLIPEEGEECSTDDGIITMLVDIFSISNVEAQQLLEAIKAFCYLESIAYLYEYYEGGE